MRNLVSIRRIDEIRPIVDAMHIELAIIGGWQCCVGKGEFKPGDYAVYFEIDSYLPIEERFEFLRKSCYQKMGVEEGFRVKTRKFRGEISQGLIMAIDKFPELRKEMDIEEIGGIDLEKLLRVKKWEEPVPFELSGGVKNKNPSDIAKASQERIQNLMNYFELYKDVEFEETEKLDGTSALIYNKKDQFGVCGHNWEFIESDNNTFWKLAKEYDLPKILKGFNVAILAELCGEGIQKNKLNIKGQKMYIFDCWDIPSQQYMRPDVRMEFLEGIYSSGIAHVPIIGVTKIFKECPNIESMVLRANGKSLINDKIIREGIVFKSMERFKSEIPSFKVLSNQYLLKNE